MKSLGKIRIPKNTVGYLSETGMYNYWYPSREMEIKIPMNTVGIHMQLWKHQHSYYAFKVPMVIFHPEKILEYKDQYVCVWFLHDDIHEIMKNSDTTE